MSDQPAHSNSKKARIWELEQEYDAAVTKKKAYMRYVPTREEQLILDECSSESMRQREIPLSLLCGFAAYSACKKGLLRGNARFGPWPHVLGIGAVGFFVGRFSFVSTCKQKLLERLPNSKLAQIIRNNGKIAEPSELMDKPNDYPSDSLHSDGSPYNSEEPSMDSNRSNDPTMPNSLVRGRTSNDQQSPSTYAELRQMSRHVQRPRTSLRPLPPDSSNENQSTEKDLVDSFDVPVAKSKPKVTNKYGDAWEN